MLKIPAVVNQLDGQTIHRKNEEKKAKHYTYEP